MPDSYIPPAVTMRPTPPIQLTPQNALIVPDRASANGLVRSNPLFIAGAIISGIVILLFLSNSLLSATKSPEFELEYSHTHAYVLISEFEVDNGERDRMFEVSIYYDERARGTQKTGEQCMALEYYDSPRTYYLDEFCQFFYVNNDPGEITVTWCAEYVASGRDYDIYGQSSSGGGCVYGTSPVVSLPNYGTYGLEDECSYSGELVEADMRLVKSLETSGLDDGDSNQYNGRISATLAFVSTYECVET